MNSSCPASVQPKTLWTRPPLSYSLLGLGACAIQILASVRPHLSRMTMAKIHLLPGCGCEGCACRGSGARGGVLFSESYLLGSPGSFVPSCPSAALLPALPSLRPSLGKHICHACVHGGMGPGFVSCFICESYFLSFLSWRKLWLCFYLRFKKVV